LRVKAELHSHTLVSDGSMDPYYLAKLTLKRGCNVLAVTDHDTFEGSLRALKAVKLHDIKDLVIVPSAEIRTEWGDILVYCPDVPEGEAPRDPYDLRDWSTENSCIVVPAHPLHPFRFSIGRRKLKEGAELWDAIEVWNSRGLALFNYPAVKLARILSKPMTSGSDAHVPSEVCTAFSEVVLDDLSAEEVVRAIARNRVLPTFNIEGMRARLESLAWAIERRLL